MTSTLILLRRLQHNNNKPTAASALRNLYLRYNSSAICSLADADIEDEIQKANERGRGLWQIAQAGEKGWGIYADADIPAFTKLYSATAVTTSETRDAHSVQIAFDGRCHVQMDYPARLINHSCDANVGIWNRMNVLGAFDYYTIADVAHGEELVWDYGGAEFDDVGMNMGRCLCGAKGCRGETIGFKANSELIRGKYHGYYAEYLQDWNKQ